MPDPDPLTAQFLAWCEAEHVPPNTIARRRSVLHGIGHAGTASRDDLEAWWASRRDRSPATRSNDLACARTFYRWCQRWEHRTDDPTVRLDAPRVPDGLPRPMPKHQLVKALAELPSELARTLALGAYAGLRVSEAAALMWTDVDIETRRIRVLNSKGGKSRTIAVSFVLIDLLLPETTGSVVTGGVPVTAAVLQRRLNRGLRRLGIDDTGHASRHRFGTMAYQATGDLIAVGRAMGHSSPTITAVYAQAADDVSERIAAAVVR